MGKLTIVIPVYNERDNILTALRRIREQVRYEYEVMVVYDSEGDSTLPELDRAEKEYGLYVNRVRNAYGQGVLNAIKTGLERADSEYVVVTMADLCDPPEVINAMLEKGVDEQADVVCGSRYMRGGSQSGGPWLKGFLSRMAGRTLHSFAGLPTNDATNSFKLYRKEFLKRTKIESTGGFELGIELVVKAWSSGGTVCEVPTSWVDRAAGRSRFQLKSWLPKYLHWYIYAFLNPPKGMPAPEKTGVLPDLPPVGGGENVGFDWIPERLQRICAWGILLAAVCWCFWNILRFGVNVPYWDDWDVVLTLNHPWTEWFRFHNEHRIVFTRMVHALFYHLNGLDLRTVLIFNFAVYIGMAGAILRMLYPMLKRFMWYPLLFLPFFVDSLGENLFWASQNQFHFMILFAVLAIIVGFQKKSSIGNAVLFGGLLVCSCFSMSIVFAAPILAIYWCKQYALAKLPGNAKHIWTHTLIASGIVFCGIGSFLLGFPGFVDLDRLYPWEGWFWVCMLASWGVVLSGVNGNSSSVHFLLPSALYLLPGLAAGWGILQECWKMRASREFFTLAAFFCAIAAATATVVYARHSNLTFRHFEIALGLSPLIGSVLMRIESRDFKKLMLLLWSVGLLCSACFLLSFQREYQKSEERLLGMEKLRRVMSTSKPCMATEIYPGDLRKHAEYLADLKLSCFDGTKNRPFVRSKK